jgi:putative acetyltransferase
VTNADIKIKTAKDSRDFIDGKAIILEYFNWLGLDLSFQNFDKEINNLAEMYSEPNGGLVLASLNDKTIGVTGIRRFENLDCELKRMFVSEDYRNLGIGRLLLEHAIEIARNLNYNKIKLDTSDTMKAAIKLYMDYGFEEISAYRYNPYDSVRYFELKLNNK